jgi:hypothetical protein
MHTEPKIEFDIALNVMGLSPRDSLYGRQSFTSICAGLANCHAIQARGWVSAYVAEPKTGYRPFYLFSRLLDLDKQEDLERHHEAEAKVQDTIKSYIKT